MVTSVPVSFEKLTFVFLSRTKEFLRQSRSITHDSNELDCCLSADRDNFCCNFESKNSSILWIIGYFLCRLCHDLQVLGEWAILAKFGVT
jgi:hypothetical protein